MFFCRKDKQGECVSVLRRLLGQREKVKVELASGMLFIDEVIGLERIDGADYAVFGTQSRVAVASIERVDAVA